MLYTVRYTTESGVMVSHNGCTMAFVQQFLNHSNNTITSRMEIYPDRVSKQAHYHGSMVCSVVAALNDSRPDSDVLEQTFQDDFYPVSLTASAF